MLIVRVLASLSHAGGASPSTMSQDIIRRTKQNRPVIKSHKSAKDCHTHSNCDLFLHVPAIDTGGTIGDKDDAVWRHRHSNCQDRIGGSRQRFMSLKKPSPGFRAKRSVMNRLGTGSDSHAGVPAGSLGARAGLRRPSRCRRGTHEANLESSCELFIIYSQSITL